MTKALVIIDLPNYLDDIDIPELLCDVKVIQDDEYIFSRHFLKLKPMPEKLDAAQITLALGKYKVEDKLLWQVNGYNRCIDLLLGEENNGKI